MTDLTLRIADAVHPHLAFGMPGGTEWIILLVIALLIFGRRLPEVGRWMGQGIVEFKKGIKGISDDIEEESSKPSTERLEDKSSEVDASPTSARAEHARQD